jgi:hypothetical protein
MPWIEHGGMRAHFRGEDTPEAREAMRGLMEALGEGGYCDLATREERHPRFDRLYERERQRMRERTEAKRDGEVR